MRRPDGASRVLAAGFALLAGVLSFDARADVYTFVDEDGVTHFTNVPPRGVKAGTAGKGDSQGSGPEIDDDSVASIKLHYRVDESRYDATIAEAAGYYSLPAALVKAVVAVESSFQAAALSRAGAQGLMQLMPKTAAAMHVRNVMHPWDNIYGGCRYLRVLANRFGGDLRLTLAAYNAGPETVERSGGVPNIPETRSYVRRVLSLYRYYLENWRVSSP